MERMATALAVCHTGLEPQTSKSLLVRLALLVRPALLLTRLRLALDRHRLASTKVPAA